MTRTTLKRATVSSFTDEISPLEITPTGENRIRVSNLSKRFERVGGQEVLAVDDISLTVRPGEFLVLLGPSGCGKTTLLRCLAGLETPDRGEIELDSQTVFSSARRVNIAPERRGASMLFQSYALWPHMTIFENVAYPLRSRRTPKSEVSRLVSEALTRVSCEHLAQQYPGDVSGGQQQRVALARALVADNSVVLFDEPLSNVDAKVRTQLRLELLSLQHRLGFSAVYVTHDQSEALELADRIAVMEEGRIAQLGSPREVYGNPASAYVARFLGTVNELNGEVLERDGALLRIRTPMGDISARPKGGDNLVAGDRVVVIWRPEACILTQKNDQTSLGLNAWRVEVDATLFLGSHFEYIVRVGDFALRTWRMSAGEVEEGSTAWLSVAATEFLVFPAEGTESATESEVRQ